MSDNLALALAYIALPLVAALQRYAVAYGFEGLSKVEAWHSARGVLATLVLLEALFWAVRLLA